MKQNAEVKGKVHTKITLLAFSHPRVFPNLYDLVFSAEHRRWFEECKHSESKHLFGVPQKTHIQCFNDIYFGLNYPFKSVMCICGRAF